MTDAPKTLIEAVEYFASPKVCFDLMLTVKWPDGHITCPKCGEENIGVITSRPMLQCKVKGCRKQFSVKVDTIFEDSPLSLQKWFVAVWCIANAKNGISSCELARALGVTQKTAWFMLHRVRLAMQTRSFKKLSGEVESDETFIGGKYENMHERRRATRPSKAIVQGLLERDGEVRCSLVKDTQDETLQSTVRRNVAFGSLVYTDAHPSYGGLGINYWHKTVDHLTRYVTDRVHTNGLENFFSLLKRTLKGTYVAVATFHLERYLDEQTFRFNQRRTTDAGRFSRALASVVGKRITYRVLTAQDDAGFMGIT